MHSTVYSVYLCLGSMAHSAAAFVVMTAGCCVLLVARAAAGCRLLCITQQPALEAKAIMALYGHCDDRCTLVYKMQFASCLRLPKANQGYDCRPLTHPTQQTIKRTYWGFHSQVLWRWHAACMRVAWLAGV